MINFVLRIWEFDNMEIKKCFNELIIGNASLALSDL